MPHAVTGESYHGFAMKTYALLVLVATLPAVAQQRPAITGISHIAVYAKDFDVAKKFYEHSMGLKKMTDPENPAGVRYYSSPTQFVEVLPLPADASIVRMNHLAYVTADAEAMRKYLAMKGVTVPATVTKLSDGSKTLMVKDPEGNSVEFVQAVKVDVSGAKPIGTKMIHVGQVVHDRAKEDTFYQGILGFRPYWWGGPQGRTAWVSQQVPDGDEWLEYMLVREDQQMTQKSTGVLNHFSLGVPNMEQAVTTMTAEDRLTPDHADMKIGGDGKWQYNNYDAENTRTEIMEFEPVAKPCCSPFTAAHPKRP